MMEFGLSKKQVLEGFFIREIPLLIYKMEMKQRYRTLEKLYDQRLYLLIASATAGIAPNADLICKLLEDIQKSIAKYEPAEESGQAENMGEPENPYEKLKRLQEIIGQTQQRKRR